jgi:hypothetical protein
MNRFPPFLVWFFLTASSVLVGVLALAGLVEVSSAMNVPGPGAPLLGGVLLFCFGILGVCVLVLLGGIRQVGKLNVTDLPISYWAISVGAFALLLFGLFSLTRTGRYTLTTQFIDPSGKPVVAGTIHYRTFSLGEGLGRFDRPAEGSTVTDANGTATFRVNHAHRVDLDIQAVGFQRTYVILEAAGRLYRHQVTSPAGGEGIEVVKPQDARRWVHLGLIIPATGDITMKVTLKKQ